MYDGWHKLGNETGSRIPGITKMIELNLSAEYSSPISTPPSVKSSAAIKAISKLDLAPRSAEAQPHS